MYKHHQDRQTTDGQAADGQTTDGQTPGGGTTGGDVPGAEATRGKATRAEATGRKATRAKATRGKATRGKATGGKATRGKATGGKATGGKATGGKATRGKATGEKATGRSSGGKAPPEGPSDNQGESRIRDEPDPRLSRSLEYGVAILECFSGEQQALGIAALADIVGISRSTTHRYAITLVALGYLEQDSKRRYLLSARAASPGSAAIGAIRRQVPARAALEELREETGHTVSMAVLDRTRLIYVHRLLGHRRGQYEIDRDLGVGATIPLHCTALGKVLLASLSDAERRELLASLELARYGPNSIADRKKLIAGLDRISVREPVVSDEELVLGARSIAVLVPRPLGEHPLAIDVTAPSAAFTVEQLLRHAGPPLKRAARLISGD